MGCAVPKEVRAKKVYQKADMDRRVNLEAVFFGVVRQEGVSWVMYI